MYMAHIGLDSLPDEILLIIFKNILPELQFNKTTKLVDFQNIWADPQKKIINTLFSVLSSSKRFYNLLHSNEYNLWKKLFHYHFRCFKVINPLDCNNLQDKKKWFHWNHDFPSLADHSHSNEGWINYSDWCGCGYKLFSKFLKLGIESNSMFLREMLFGDALQYSQSWINYLNYQNMLNKDELYKTKKIYFDFSDDDFRYPHPLDCENTSYSFINYLKIIKYDVEQISRTINIKKEDMINENECKKKKNYILIQSLSDENNNNFVNRFPMIEPHFGLIQLLLETIKSKEMTTEEILNSTCYDLYYYLGNPCFCPEHYHDEHKSIICVKYNNDFESFFRSADKSQIVSHKSSEISNDNINYKKLFISKRFSFLKKTLTLSEWKKLSPIWLKTTLESNGANGAGKITKCIYKTKCNFTKLAAHPHGLNCSNFNISNSIGYSSSGVEEYYNYIKRLTSDNELKTLTYFESQKQFHLRMIKEIEKEEEELKRKANKVINEAYQITLID